MAEKEVGRYSSSMAAIAGIFTERDYARKLALRGRTSMDTPVRDVMTASVLCVRPNQTSEQCMQQIMTGKRLRHLPVVEEDGKLLGMISIGDLGKGHHLRAEIHHRAAGALHHRWGG